MRSEWIPATSGFRVALPESRPTLSIHDSGPKSRKNRSRNFACGGPDPFRRSRPHGSPVVRDFPAKLDPVRRLPRWVGKASPLRIRITAASKSNCRPSGAASLHGATLALLEMRSNGCAPWATAGTAMGPPWDRHGTAMGPPWDGHGTAMGGLGRDRTGEGSPKPSYSQPSFAPPSLAQAGFATMVIGGLGRFREIRIHKRSIAKGSRGLRAEAHGMNARTATEFGARPDRGPDAIELLIEAWRCGGDETICPRAEGIPVGARAGRNLQEKCDLEECDPANLIESSKPLLPVQASVENRRQAFEALARDSTPSVASYM
jgi:hypothetical protein